MPTRCVPTASGTVTKQALSPSSACSMPLAMQRTSLLSSSRNARLYRVQAVFLPPTRSHPNPNPNPSEAPLIRRTELAAIWDMARPINLIPSYCLVLLGAWAAGGRSVFALAHSAVWLMGLISTAIAMASCIVNDYFDFTAGRDTIGSPTKPIPSGTVPSEHALLVAAAAYTSVLFTACLFPDPRMRLVIAASAAITLLYTPILKQISFIKNAAVAATIASAPLAGAFATGAAGGHLRVVAAPCAFLFLAVCYREILMDVNDVEGDGAARVKTLPVLLGPGAALGAGVALLTGCLALVLAAAAHGAGLAWTWRAMPQLEIYVRFTAGVAGFAAVARPMIAALQLWRTNFPPAAVSAAVDETLATVGFGTILLAFMA